MVDETEFPHSLSIWFCIWLSLFSIIWLVFLCAFLVVGGFLTPKQTLKLQRESSEKLQLLIDNPPYDLSRFKRTACGKFVWSEENIMAATHMNSNELAVGKAGLLIKKGVPDNQPKHLMPPWAAVSFSIPHSR